MICFIIRKIFDTELDIRGSNSNIFKNQRHHQEDFTHHNFRGCFIVDVVFYFERHTYNCSDNGERILILPKLEIKTINLRRREYKSRLHFDYSKY